MKHKRLIMGFILTAIAGFLLGILVQAGQNAFGWYRTPLLAAFGVISYGLFFWIAVCTVLSYHSRCGLHASLLVLCLLIPTLFGYALTARYLGCRLNDSVMAFGLLMLLPSALAAWVLRAHRHSLVMRGFLSIAGVAALLFDIAARGDFTFRALSLALPLMVCYLYTVHTAPKRAPRRHSPMQSVYTVGL